MRLACQPIARRANREDEVDGRFFAKRFDCKRLRTCADVLACSIYVDLNPIHAGVAASPEQSEFTSAFDRIHARWQQTQAEIGDSVSLPSEAYADAWLAPVFIDERAESYSAATSTETAGQTDNLSSPSCNPTGSPRISNKGFLPVQRDQYLSLIDILGRMVRKGKRGFIPPELPPILERIQVDTQSWLESVLERFLGDPLHRTTPAVNAPG